MSNLVLNDSPFTKKLRSLAFLTLAIGGLGSVLVAVLDLPHGLHNFFGSYLLAFMYFTGIAVTALFFSALQFLVRAGWSASVRRITEMFTGFVPYIAVLVLPILFGMGHLFHWMHPEDDKILAEKTAYLNPIFFIIRIAIYIGVWFLMYRYIVGNSFKQDNMPDDYTPTKKNFKRAAVFVLLYAMTITFAAFDLLMSLEPHWYSTIFGIHIFAGNFVATLSLTAIFTVYLMRRGYLKGFVTTEHLHDLGKLMFAFNVFWAYISFSQYFLIWYANLPEETFYFIHRTEHGWQYLGIAILLVHFVVPFFLLLRQDAKRKQTMLLVAGFILLAAHFIDLAWIVLPVFSKHSIGNVLTAIPLFIFMLGIFLFSIVQRYQKNNIVAINDPYLAESIELIS